MFLFDSHIYALKYVLKKVRKTMLEKKSQHFAELEQLNYKGYDHNSTNQTFVIRVREIFTVLLQTHTLHSVN